MKRIRHSPERIIGKLREANAELAKGIAVSEICKALGIAENTYYRRQNQFVGITDSSNANETRSIQSG